MPRLTFQIIFNICLSRLTEQPGMQTEIVVSLDQNRQAWISGETYFNLAFVLLPLESWDEHVFYAFQFIMAGVDAFLGD